VRFTFLRPLLPWQSTTVLGLWLAFLFAGLSLWRETSPSSIQFLDDLEEAVRTWKFRVRGVLRPGGDVVIAAVDERALARFGRWPWGREVFATLVERLGAYRAKTVAFDVVFDEPDLPPGRAEARQALKALALRGLREGAPELKPLEALAAHDPDARFASAIQRARNVVLGFFLFKRAEDAHGVTRGEILKGLAQVERASARVVLGQPGHEGTTLLRAEGLRAPIEPLARAAGKWMGYFNTLPEADVRSFGVPLAATVDEFCFFHLAVLAAAHFVDDYPLLRFHPDLPPRISIGEALVPSELFARFYPNFYGPKNTFAQFSVADIVDGAVPPERLQGKLVFVGATALAVPDLRRTPFDASMPGVELNATVADNILTRRFLERPLLLSVLELVILLALGPALARLLARARLGVGLLASVASLVAMGVADLLLFREGYLVRSALFYGEIVLVVLASYILLYFRVYKERRRLRNTMQHYLAPAVLEEMLRDESKLKLGGEKRELTVLFSDIRGFTALAESFDARDLVAFLNEYFTPMTEIVLRNQGTFDKYMGDAIMAFFGAPQEMPDHAARACRTALDMRTELTRLNARWRQRGLRPIEVGIGINTGVVAFGNMGSARLFNYTVIGDHVNLASRLEATHKLFGAPIVVTERTALAARGAFLFRRIGAVYVPGRREAVEVHELLGPIEEERVLAPWLAAFAEGVARFEARDLEAARAAFEEAGRLQPDPVARAYLARIAEPPGGPGWDPAWRSGK
jgi:adenylate cyclase